jgi:hypothetical protein
MYCSHSEIRTPNISRIIWRYMSLDKFLSLLNDKQLYFTRQDKFDDSKEGKLARQDSALYNYYVPGSAKNIEKQGCAYINCWIMSDFEQYLMWGTYASLDKGIAIKSTIGNLIKSLDSNDKRCIYISDVDYIDYTTDLTFEKAGGSANGLARYFCKRKYFQQENELRLVYYDYLKNLDKDNKDVGMKIDVSLDTLIDEICIAPCAEKWYYDLVKKEVENHHINKCVYLSQI